MPNRDASAAKAKRQPSIDKSVVERYETQLQEARRAIEAEKYEKTLTEAFENRELMAILMEDDWLGLRLLSYLRSSPRTVSDLASKTGKDVDCVAATVARLFRFGAADVQGGLFICVGKGCDLLKNIEAQTGVSLTPQTELATAQS